MATEIEKLMIQIMGDARSYLRATKDVARATITLAQEQQRMRARQQRIDEQNAQQSIRTATELVKRATEIVFDSVSTGVNAFKEFNQAMSESVSIMGDITTKEIRDLTDAAKRLSEDLAVTPTQIGKAYYYLASAGMNAKQSMTALGPVARFAMAGAFNLERATELAAGAQAALGMTSQDTEVHMRQLVRITDVLVKANTLAQASTLQFADSITTDAGATARQYGIDLEQVTAALAAYATQNVRGRLAGGHMARTIRLLSQAALTNAKEHKQLGFEVFDATGKFRNIADVIENLETILKGYSDKAQTAILKTLGFEALTQRAIRPLIGMSQKIREFEKTLREAGGTTQDVANKQMKSFYNQSMLVTNQVNLLAIEFGEMLAPALVAIGKAIIVVVKLLRDLNPELRTFLALSGVIAATVISLIAGVAGAIALVNILFGGAFLWIGLITTALVAISATLAMFVVKIGGIEAAVERLSRAFQRWGDWMQPIFNALQDLGNTIWNTMSKLFDNLVELAGVAWKQIFGDVAVNWDKIRNAIVTTVHAIEFAIINIIPIFQLAWVALKIGWMQFSSEVTFFFTDRWPALLKFFGAAFLPVLEWTVKAYQLSVKHMLRLTIYTVKQMARYWGDTFTAVFDWFRAGFAVVAFDTPNILVQAAIAGSRAMKRVITADFESIFDSATSTFKQLATNIGNLFKYMDKLLSGQISFGDVWKDITRQAKDMKPPELELPKLVLPELKLPDRPLGAEEEKLKKEYEKLAGEIGETWQEFLRKKKYADAPPTVWEPNKKEIVNSLGNIGEEAGKSFNEGLTEELKKVDSFVRRYSMDAAVRIYEYMEILKGAKPFHGAAVKRIGKQGRDAIDPGIFNPENAMPRQNQVAANAAAADTNKLLDQIRKNTEVTAKAQVLKIESADFANV